MHAKSRLALLTAVSTTKDMSFAGVLERHATLKALDGDANLLMNQSDHRISQVKKTGKHDQDGWRTSTNRSPSPTRRDQWGPSKSRKGDKRTRKECSFCRKTGHNDDECWFKYPEQRPPKRHTYQVKTIRVNNLQSQRNRIYREVDVGGQKILFMLDTGSDVSVISRKTWESLGKPKLAFPKKIQLRCVNNTQLKMVGTLATSIQYEEVTMQAKLHVADMEGANLLGIDLLGLFDLRFDPVELPTTVRLPSKTNEEVNSQVDTIPDEEASTQMRANAKTDNESGMKTASPKTTAHVTNVDDDKCGLATTTDAKNVNTLTTCQGEIDTVTQTVEATVHKCDKSARSSKRPDKVPSRSAAAKPHGTQQTSHTFDLNQMPGIHHLNTPHQPMSNRQAKGRSDSVRRSAHDGGGRGGV